MSKGIRLTAITMLLGMVLLGGVSTADARATASDAIIPTTTTPVEPAAAPRSTTRAASFVPSHVGDFPPEAIAAWDKVNAALLRHITLVVDVEVKIEWKAIEDGYIGMGGSEGSQKDFASAPFANTWYPISLANQIAGERLSPGPDVGVDMSSVVKWDYSGNPPQALKNGVNDYVTTLMHEILHGMGFSGTAAWVDGEGQLGDGDGEVEPDRRRFAHLPTAQRSSAFLCVVPVRKAAPAPKPLRLNTTAGSFAVWDHFVVDGTGALLTDANVYPNPSEKLGDVLTSDDLFWNGGAGIAANGGKPVKLYAPEEWSGPSSYSHLDDATYDGGPDSILTSAGEKMPNIELGPRVIGMLGDMGWKIH